jgi:hypothetical protein
MRAEDPTPRRAVPRSFGLAGIVMSSGTDAAHPGRMPSHLGGPRRPRPLWARVTVGPAIRSVPTLGRVQTHGAADGVRGGSGQWLPTPVVGQSSGQSC